MKKIYFLSLFLLTTIIFLDSCSSKEKTKTSKIEISETEVINAEKIDKDNVQNYKIDVEKTVVEWIGKKTTGSHNGTVLLEKGVMSINKNGDVVGGKFMINMQTIECTDLQGSKKESLEEHLKDEDFFNTTEHQKASFIIERVDSINIYGTITIKGISEAVNFEYSKLNDYQYEAEITIDRTLFDIKYKSKTIFPELGDNFIHDNFIIHLNPLSISK